MCIVGYLDATDPATPFGADFTLVGHSRGPLRPAGSALGPPGHALIPMAALTRPGDLCETWITIDSS